jgi:phage shock protein A
MLQNGTAQAKLARLSAKVDDGDSRNHAARALVAIVSSETLDERFATMEQNDQIEALLLELKERQPRLSDHS